ncbi:hypothetical protein [Streptomyces sp. NBC_00525]|uniref:hypothetical protein n=1 Tax=Streptomyces sp. NBC_00525 TaxID=2903660 RepID=UPI002E820496|nr:hypothetical protein [Streptomyces sp. NBC_00525]WUC97946.1 hypothetical protein OG710_30200 [Streptomyces sp. NBC_00525]
MNTRTRTTPPTAPWAPVPKAAAPRPATVLLTVLLGALTLISVAWITFLVWIVAVWGAAAGEPTGGYLALYAACLATGAALLAALATRPAIRRMPPPRRALLLNAVACPIPLTLAILTWTTTG